MNIHFPATTTTSIYSQLHSDSLQKAATKWTLFAALAGMAGYGTIEYITTGSQSLSDFALHHLLDVTIVMIAVWFASWLAIRRSVIEPVRRIFLHVRRMGSGRVEYLEGEMGSRELADVAASINRLVVRLARDPDEQSVHHGLDSLRSLRAELQKVSNNLGDSGVPVMKALANLEGSLLHMLADLPQPLTTATETR